MDAFLVPQPADSDSDADCDATEDSGSAQDEGGAGDCFFILGSPLVVKSLHSLLSLLQVHSTAIRFLGIVFSSSYNLNSLDHVPWDRWLARTTCPRLCFLQPLLK